MKRPVSLTIAVVLQWISAVAGIIAGIGLLLTSLAMLSSDARSAVEEALKEAGIADVSGSTIGAGLLVVAVLLLILSAVRVIVAVSLGRGRNWARILITVIAALDILVSLGQLIGGEIISGLIGLAIEVVILWLIWNSASSAYIRERSAVRS